MRKRGCHQGGHKSEYLGKQQRITSRSFYVFLPSNLTPSGLRGRYNYYHSGRFCLPPINFSFFLFQHSFCFGYPLTLNPRSLDGAYCTPPLQRATCVPGLTNQRAAPVHGCSHGSSQACERPLRRKLLCHTFAASTMQA